jgi:hypothetical protein
MTPSTVKKLSRISAPAPPEASPLQLCLAHANAADEVAEQMLTRKQLAAFWNIRLRIVAIRESELEARRAA